MGESRRNPRPSPAFLAHLIATAQRSPQTRQRGRTAAAEAVARYADAVPQATAARRLSWSI